MCVVFHGGIFSLMSPSRHIPERALNVLPSLENAYDNNNSRVQRWTNIEWPMPTIRSTIIFGQILSGLLQFIGFVHLNNGWAFLAYAKFVSSLFSFQNTKAKRATDFFFRNLIEMVSLLS